MKRIIYFILLILFSNCDNKPKELIMFKGKMPENEYLAFEKSINHFNVYLRKCYPNLNQEDSYKQFVKDFIKDSLKKGVFIIENDKYINSHLLNNSDIFIKIKNKNESFKNPYKGDDIIFDEFYPELYIINSNSEVFKIIESNSSKNLKKYLNKLKNNNEYYDDSFTNYFLFNIDESDYKYSSTKLIIMLNFYYNININRFNLFEYEFNS